jgi:hypothetical protein
MVASSGVRDVRERVTVPPSAMPEIRSLPLPPRPWIRAYVTGLLVFDLVAALGAGLIGTTARFHGALAADTTVPAATSCSPCRWWCWPHSRCATPGARRCTAAAGPATV